MTLQEFYLQHRQHEELRLEEFLWLRIQWAARYQPNTLLGYRAIQYIAELRRPLARLKRWLRLDPAIDFVEFDQ